MGGTVTTGDWKNMLLHNSWIKEDIKEEIKRFLEINDNEETSYQNLWDRAKAVHRGELLAVEYYKKKEKKSKINNLETLLKCLENQ